MTTPEYVHTLSRIKLAGEFLVRGLSPSVWRIPIMGCSYSQREIGFQGSEAGFRSRTSKRIKDQG